MVAKSDVMMAVSKVVTLVQKMVEHLVDLLVFGLVARMVDKSAVMMVAC